MFACPHHNRTPKGKVCPHLPFPQDDYIQRFTGLGLEYDLLCRQCAQQLDADVESTLVAMCAECFEHVEDEGCWDGILGRPQVRIAAQEARFVHETFELPG
jgi:hypothetical protein